MPYGLSDLIASSRAADLSEVTLVEGVMDVHVLRANGARSVAALGGASVSTAVFEHLAGANVERVVLALDNDAAGRTATKRAIDASARARRSPDVWVVDPDLYGTAKDPGDVVRTGGSDAWRETTAAPTCAITWRALDLTGPITSPDDQGARRTGLARAGAWLGSLPPRLAVEQDAALDVVAESLGHDRAAVRRAFRARYWRREPVPEASRLRGAGR